MTKGQEIYDKVNELVASGTDKADAFRQLSESLKRPFDSVRGSYYSHKKKIEGGETKSRTRRRETTPEDALADARASLERSIASIDRERPPWPWRGGPARHTVRRPSPISWWP